MLAIEKQGVGIESHTPYVTRSGAPSWAQQVQAFTRATLKYFFCDMTVRLNGWKLPMMWAGHV